MSQKNSGKRVTKAIDYPDQPGLPAFLDNYKVYPALTAKLDRFTSPFTQEVINEIVLWKVARYVALSDDILCGLGELRKLQPGDEDFAFEVFANLLSANGVRLPMASTFLRFANPSVFQILDRHLYRAVFGILPGNLSKKPADCWTIYKDFLAQLRIQCEQLEIPFEDADRTLFEYDKAVNPPLSQNP